MTSRYFTSFYLIIVLALAALTSQAQLTRRGADTLNSGAVYVMTNQIANSVIAFSRNPADGTLNEVTSALTQGAGDPMPALDPLGSQGSLILSENSRFLFAVNAGSNEISVLSIGKAGLSFVDKISSGGTRPISLTTYGDWLYVLNAGDTPNITGFWVDDSGMLTPIPNSTRSLIGGDMAAPAQVGFSPDGTLLAVTEKMGNRIDTYTVDQKGVPSEPISNPSIGMTPFGFAFTNAGSLIVSEAFGGMPGLSAVSSYSASSDGMLTVNSGSVGDGETAACWVVVTNSGKLAYVANSGSATISIYGIGSNGVLTLVDSEAANTGGGSVPTDMALSINSQFLYVLESGSMLVSGYRIGKSGSLTSIGEFGTLPSGVQGIAAK